MRYYFTVTSSGMRYMSGRSANHLIALKNLVEERIRKEKQTSLRLPDLLIILTGGELSYTRADGVKVIPLGCLKD